MLLSSPFPVRVGRRAMVPRLPRGTRTAALRRSATIHPFCEAEPSSACTRGTQGRRDDMDLQLKNKTALVTGASIGIGHAIARGLAAEGVRVCIAARRSNLLDALAREIAERGDPPPQMVAMDLMQEGAAERLAEKAAK